MHLFNTLSRQKDLFEPQGDVITMYTCGPTVYDFAHIGNFRAYIFADVLFRYLKYRFEREVKWVMNITDIDDKTIRDSKNEGGDPMENLQKFTGRYEAAFLEDLEKVLIRKDDFYQIPRATEHIGEMQNLIREIYKNGYAYVSDGSVYFSLQKYMADHQYGKLVHIDHEEMRQGVRIDKDEYEREQVSDFVLWKGKKEDEPYWTFELDGQDLTGRPGWHIECSAMEKQYFDLPFDIHTGGVDLAFPHHEDEIAQSAAGYQSDPTRFWCHNEYLMVNGEKMSKSKGNFFTLRDLEKRGLDLLDYRYLVASVHYRSKMNFTWEAMEAAGQARKKLLNLMTIVQQSLAQADFGAIAFEGEVDALRLQFQEALDDDLNTPKALAHIFEFVKMFYSSLEKGKYSEQSLRAVQNFFGELNQVLALLPDLKDLNVTVPAEVRQLVEQREQARLNKDFIASDQLRSEIQALGYDVRDGKDGVQIFKL